MNNNFDKTDETSGMHIVEYNMSKQQKMKVSVWEYIVWAFFTLLFLLVLIFILAYIFESILMHRSGNEEGAIWTLLFLVIMPSPGLLLFGLPAFFLGRNIFKNRKNIKKYSDIIDKDNCVMATVKDIDFMDHTYANDEYWLVCDVINEADHTIHRYKSERVKEDLFLKFKEGDRIAVYIHPEEPEAYYVDVNQNV